MNIEKSISFKTKSEKKTLTNISNNNFNFVLLNNFSLSDFSSTMEVLRLANKITGEKIFSWKLLSVHNLEVKSSNGLIIKTDCLLEDVKRNENIVICSGENVKKESSKELIAWIRRHYRKGINIIGMYTSTQIMAMAGLLKDKKCTIHWESRENFLEEFPDYNLSSSVYSVDGNCFTSAGGTASLDLFLYIIAKIHSNDLSNLVADKMNHSSVRTDKDDQRLSFPKRIGIRHPKLSSVLEIMENSIEEPVSPSFLAKKVGMSTRQLERLFRRYLNLSPKKYFMELRLKKSKNLLTQTNMSIINVAMSCGFSSPSHFSKCYRNHFNITPYKEREQKCF